MMKHRKPILILDDSTNSQRIRKLFYDNEIDYVEYHIKKFQESCCGELPTTRAPSVIAVDGIYKEEDSIKELINKIKKNKTNWKLEDSESSFW